MLAVGSNYGERFDAPIKLNQDEGEAERAMPSVAMSLDGVAHTVWLDPREAPRGMEEPSDLYYASVKDGTVHELNLISNQKPTGSWRLLWAKPTTLVRSRPENVRILLW
jgi:hypothetical protein